MAGREPLAVVGAGLVGSLLATMLAKRGYAIRLFERRPDMRRVAPGSAGAAGRSINLAVSVRGLHALKQVGLEQEVLRRAIPMKGRMMHAVDGTLTFQRYGRDDSECINSVSRAELNQLLMTQAEATGNVEILFGHRLVAADLKKGECEFELARGEAARVSAPAIFGTDGSASALRAEILRASGASQSAPQCIPKCTEDLLEHGYKELTIPAGAGGSFRIEKNALHIWPRGSYMLIALPNLDGSFTCTLFLPQKGPLSFEALQDGASVRRFFEAQFGDVVPLMPDLETLFFENPTGHMVTVKCEPWNQGGRALLLGDAAHAIVPFFGQGMNCGFEDCTVLDELLSTRSADGFEGVFPEFVAARKRHADAIADMAIENFVEMRDKVGDPRFLMEKAVERVLQQRFPGEYVSRYALVTFSRSPYRFAYEMGEIQADILKELCAGIRRPEDVDLARADELVRTRLSPLFQKLETTKGSTYGS